MGGVQCSRAHASTQSRYMLCRWGLPLHPSLIALDKLQSGRGRGGLMAQQWRLHTRVTCVRAHLEHGMCRLQWLQTHDGELLVYAQLRQLQQQPHEEMETEEKNEEKGLSAFLFEI